MNIINNDNNNIDINQVFNAIKDYPLWMYRNNVIKDLIVWLKTYNIQQKNKNLPMVQLFGIDMQCYYSLNELKKYFKKHSNILINSKKILLMLENIKLFDNNNGNNQYIVNQLQKIYSLFLSNIERNQIKYKILSKYK